MTLLGASLITSACATKSQTGAATGAVAGGLVGAAVGNTSGALIGAALGGALGYGVGRSMEIEDQRRMAYALEANRQVQWTNPDTGYRYEMAPTDTYYDEGRECREFRMLAEVDGRPEQVTGSACRLPNGTWDMDT
jgi:surface antigen